MLNVGGEPLTFGYGVFACFFVDLQRFCCS